LDVAVRANRAANAPFRRLDSPPDNKQTIISRHASAVAQATPGRRAIIFSSYTASAGLRNREHKSRPTAVSGCALLMTQTSRKASPRRILGDLAAALLDCARGRPPLEGRL